MNELISELLSSLFNVGDFVKVKNTFDAYIIDKHEVNEDVTFKVKYILDNKIEENVKLQSLSVINLYDCGLHVSRSGSTRKNAETNGSAVYPTEFDRNNNVNDNTTQQQIINVEDNEENNNDNDINAINHTTMDQVNQAGNHISTDTNNNQINSDRDNIQSEETVEQELSVTNQQNTNISNHDNEQEVHVNDVQDRNQDSQELTQFKKILKKSFIFKTYKKNQKNELYEYL